MAEKVGSTIGMPHITSRQQHRSNKKANSDFFTSRGAYIKLRYIAILYTHSIGNLP